MITEKTLLDTAYFLPQNFMVKECAEKSMATEDHRFRTNRDGEWAQYLSMEMLSNYFAGRFRQLAKEEAHRESKGAEVIPSEPRVKWIGPKVAALEGLIGWYELGYIEAEREGLKALVEAFSEWTGVEFPNLYSTLKDLRDRKERVVYLKKMISALEKRLEKGDL